MPTPRLGPRLPQRRPGPERRRGAGLPRPGRRPGQARRPPDRARRDRQRPARPPRASPARPPPSAPPGRATGSWSATSRPTRLSTPGPRWPTSAPPCRPRWCRGWWSWTRCRPDLGQGRPRRPAVAGDQRGQRAPAPKLEGTAAWVHELWTDLLGAEVDDPGADFFDLGGSSLTAAQLVSRLRSRFPEVTVADVYETPTLGALATALDGMDSPAAVANRTVSPVPVKTQIGQAALHRPAAHPHRPALAGLDRGRGEPGPRGVGPGLAAGHLLVAGRRGLAPPDQPAGSAGDRGRRAPGWCCGASGRAPTHGAGRRTCGSGSPSASPTRPGVLNLAGAPALKLYARALGVTVGKDVDLHSAPPVTGLLTPGRGLLGRGRGRPRRLLARRRRAPRRAASRSATNARIGTRSTLCPGAVIGASAEVGAGSAVFGEVPAGEYWSGAPASRVAEARGPWSDAVPQNRRALGRWPTPPPPCSSPCCRSLAVLAAACWRCRRGCATPPRSGDAFWTAVATLPLATVVGLRGARPAGGGRRTAAGDRPRARPPPGARPPGLAGVVHAPAPRRVPRLALPAVRQHRDARCGCVRWAPRSARRSRRRRCC